MCFFKFFFEMKLETEKLFNINLNKSNENVFDSFFSI